MPRKLSKKLSKKLSRRTNRRNTIRRKPVKKSRRNMKRSRVNKSKRNNRKRNKRSMRKNMRGGGTTDLGKLYFYKSLREELENKLDRKKKTIIGKTLIFTKGAVEDVLPSDIKRAIDNSALTNNEVDTSIIIDDGDTKLDGKAKEGSFTWIGEGIRENNVVSMKPMVESKILKEYSEKAPNNPTGKNIPIDTHIFKKHYGLHGACVTLAVNDYFDSDQTHFNELVYIESRPEGVDPGDSLQDEITYWKTADSKGDLDFVGPGSLANSKRKN